MLVPIGTIIAIEQKGCSCDASPALIGPDDTPAEPRTPRVPDSVQCSADPVATAIVDASDRHLEEDSEYSTRFGGESIATPHSNR
ncbi:MAG: hypothetical protein V5A21_11895 [Halapricum sp.]